MRIWLTKIGEPLPIGCGSGERLHRTGTLAMELVRRGHHVTWWTSTFDRVSRRNLFDRDTDSSVEARFDLNMIHTPGYRRSISWQRLRDQRLMARAFARRVGGEPPPDAVLCAYPTIELSKACVAYGKTRGIPVVLDLRDMWPDIIVTSMPSVLRPLARLALRSMYRDAAWACRNASALTGITEEFVNWGLNKAGRSPSERDRAFPLGYHASVPVAEDLVEAERFWDGLGVPARPVVFTACFLGTLGHQFDLHTVISAALELSARGNFKLVVCGTGESAEKVKRWARGHPAVLLPGWIKASQMYVLMRRCHVGLNPIPDRYDFLATINNKAIEYLSAGLPIVMSPTKGVLHRLIRSRGCGVGYEPGSVSGLVDALEGLSASPETREAMSERATRLFRESFTATHVYGDMAEYLVGFARNLAGRE